MINDLRYLFNFIFIKAESAYFDLLYNLSNLLFEKCQCKNK